MSLCGATCHKLITRCGEVSKAWCTKLDLLVTAVLLEYSIVLLLLFLLPRRCVDFVEPGISPTAKQLGFQPIQASADASKETVSSEVVMQCKSPSSEHWKTSRYSIRVSSWKTQVLEPVATLSEYYKTSCTEWPPRCIKGHSCMPRYPFGSKLATTWKSQRNHKMTYGVAESEKSRS